MTETFKKNKEVIAVIGLGYVGLPLAVAFGSHFETIGYDVNKQRVDEISAGFDQTSELSSQEIESSIFLELTHDPDCLKKANNFIVTVPTPVNTAKEPDLTPLLSACELLGKVIKPGDLIVFESTVFPGATEEVCVPAIELKSGLKFNKDFFCGYSPERINPGDRSHTLNTIVKITSGSTPKYADKVDYLYSTIVDAGTYKVESMIVAEAAKVIENIQRDINIALVNELSVLFSKLDLDTNEVLDAACTKWNFLNFRPGLVGGHCIGVDPYYLLHKAKKVNFDSNIIAAGRELNDSMSDHVCELIIERLQRKNVPVKGCKGVVFGITFKEDCPDIRNSKIFDVLTGLKANGIDLVIHDPLADKEAIENISGLRVLENLESASRFELVLLAVAHQPYKRMGHEYFQNLRSKSGIFFDLKGCFNKKDSDLRL